LFSPNIDKIEVVRKGDVNRAKLYYLRDRTGKRARIADSGRKVEIDQYVLSEDVEEEVKISVEPSTENEQIKPEEVVSETSQSAVAEEATTVEGKSESTASEAENTEDETKS